MRVPALLLFLCSLSALAADAGTAAELAPPGLRLPPGAHPLEVAATLAIDPSRDAFDGEVRISLAVDAATKILWLNATELEAHSAELSLGGKAISLRPQPAGPDFLALAADEPFGPGKGTLRIRYSGKIDRERSRGLYSQQEGKDWYAYTFFEPIDARRVFPSFDEPSFKVPWQLALKVPQDDGAFANARAVREDRDGTGWKTVTFAATRPIPSYLVAFVVGPFDVLEAAKAGRNGVPVRLVLPKGRGGDARYAREVTPRIVSLLEDFIGLPYPYDKLDVAVVPRFWGTMEHPGLVALGQPLALIPASDDSEERRQRYANVAIHELAHYWYGDYVTMAWWDDTWLNESLASWVDAAVTDRFEPSWHQPARDAAVAAFAMGADSKLAAAALRAPVASREDIGASFDNGITYAKGALLLRMLSGWLGEEKTRSVLRGYLQSHQWGNATAEDFQAAFRRGAGEDASAVLHSFIGQPGLPILDVQLTCEKGRPSMAVSQQRFVERGAAPKQLWTLPVCVRSGGSPGAARQCVVLKQERARFPLAGRCPAWLIPNAGGEGYYRVRYTPDQAEALLTRTPQATPAERLAIASDVAVLARRGELPVDRTLALAEPLAKDPEPAMLRASLDMTSAVRLAPLSDELRQRWNGFVRRAYAPKLAALGWDPKPGEGEDARRNRTTLLFVLGLSEDRAVLAEANRRVVRWLQQGEGLDPGLLDPALLVAAYGGDAALFDGYVARAKKVEDRAQKEQLLGALGGFRDPALAKRALALLDGKDFDLRETRRTLRNILMVRETRDLALDFLQQHLDELIPRMRDDELTWLFEGATLASCDPDHLRRAEGLFRPRLEKAGVAARVLDRAVESGRSCIADWEKNRPAVEAFLKSQPE